MSCGSSPSRAAAFTGSRGLYWEKTRDKNSGSTYYMPGLQHQQSGVRVLQRLLHGHSPPAQRRCLPREWYALYDALGLPADDRVHQHQLRHHEPAQRRSGHGALPLRFQVLQSLRPVRLPADLARRQSGLLAQVGQPLRDQLQVHRQSTGYATVLAGIP